MSIVAQECESEVAQEAEPSFFTSTTNIPSGAESTPSGGVVFSPLEVYPEATIAAIAAGQRAIAEKHAGQASLTKSVWLGKQTLDLGVHTQQVMSALEMIANTQQDPQTAMAMIVTMSKALAQKAALHNMFVARELRELDAILVMERFRDRYNFYQANARVSQTADPDTSARCDERCSIGKGPANSVLYKQKCCGAYVCGDCLHKHNFDRSSWGLSMYAECFSCRKPRKIYKD